jgi:protein gp37
MAERTEIAWADSTLNPWIGCQKVSPGCDHCYAESWSDRFHFTEWGPHGARRRTSPAKWREPSQVERRGGGLPAGAWSPPAGVLRLARRLARQPGAASLAADLLALIDATPELDWLLLTKRPENVGKFVPAAWWGRPNVWFGITAEDQAHFERRWPIARKSPATIHFVSYEPALGPLDIRRCGAPYPDWIIYGGESGSGARPAETEWASDVIEQCREVGSAVFVKQLGRNARAASRPLPSRDRAKGGDRKNGRQSCACGNFLLSLDDSLLRCASAELDRSPSRQADRQRQRRHRERDKWG